jgi:hypothetical protein
MVSFTNYSSICSCISYSRTRFLWSLLGGLRDGCHRHAESKNGVGQTSVILNDETDLANSFAFCDACDYIGWVFAMIN